MSSASRYWVMAIGLRNSPSRISPGVMFASSLLFTVSDNRTNFVKVVKESGRESAGTSTSPDVFEALMASWR